MQVIWQSHFLPVFHMHNLVRSRGNPLIWTPIVPTLQSNLSGPLKFHYIDLKTESWLFKESEFCALLFSLLFSTGQMTMRTENGT